MQMLSVLVVALALLVASALGQTNCNCPTVAEQPQAPYSLWSAQNIVLGDYSSVDEIVTPESAILEDNSSATYIWVGQAVVVDYKVHVSGGFLFIENPDDAQFEPNQEPPCRVCQQNAPGTPTPFVLEPQVATGALQDLIIWQDQTEACGLQAKDKIWGNVVIGRRGSLRLNTVGQYNFTTLTAHEDSSIIIDVAGTIGSSSPVVTIAVFGDIDLQERVKVIRALGSENVVVNFVQYGTTNNFFVKVGNFNKNRVRTQEYNIFAASPTGAVTIGNRVSIIGTVQAQGAIYVGNNADITTPPVGRLSAAKALSVKTYQEYAQTCVTRDRLFMAAKPFVMLGGKKEKAI